jgi:hypothetical protein
MIEAAQVEMIFDSTFTDFSTQLKGGAGEPFYQASQGKGLPNLIYYRQDYTASALHEVSHWCLAGTPRRKLDDFGYWYVADRSGQQQLAFEQLEARPQALEWIFSIAAGLPFRVSVDNCRIVTGRQFKKQIQHAVAALRLRLPTRAGLMADALSEVSGHTHFLNSQHFERLPL